MQFTQTTQTISPSACLPISSSGPGWHYRIKLCATPPYPPPPLFWNNGWTLPWSHSRRLLLQGQTCVTCSILSLTSPQSRAWRASSVILRLCKRYYVLQYNYICFFFPKKKQNKNRQHSWPLLQKSMCSCLFKTEAFDLLFSSWCHLAGVCLHSELEAVHVYRSSHPPLLSSLNLNTCWRHQIPSFVFTAPSSWITMTTAIHIMAEVWL